MDDVYHIRALFHSNSNDFAVVILVDDVVVIAVHREPQSLYNLASVASTNVTQVYILAY